MDVESLRCRNCDNEFVNNIIKTLALPSTNWEILSELWSCHPSHEPPISLQLRNNICYVGLFYCHIQGDSVIEDSLIQTRGFYSCKNCSEILGYTALDSNIFFRHKISPNLISIEELLEEAFIERINEANRDIVIGDLEIRLLKWDTFIFIRGQFEQGYQILYKQTQNKGLIIPEEDIEKIKESLENIHKLLPKEKRNYFDWKISYLISKRFK